MGSPIGKDVWVRSLEDILSTLDADGKLDGLPFMPEMARYCGRRFRISHVTRRTCVEGYPGRRAMMGTVFLGDLRCDGASHDGCQRGCRLFWKEAWLSDQPPLPSAAHEDSTASTRGPLKTREGERYYCQSTELAGATSDLRGPDIVHHVRDVWFGEIGLARFSRHAARAVLGRFRRLVGRGRQDDVRGGLRKTDAGSLDLGPGEWVEVKSREEIEATLDAKGRNRGLGFDRVMLEFCGKRYRVARRVDRIILEETGRMVFVKNTVILEDVVCGSFGCPRANLLYWREAWLRRLPVT